MKQGLVSVIMPCYNQGRFLSEALESVLRQTYPEWECIVIDDGSTDNSREVAKAYGDKDARIRYIYQENAGVIAARNHAIAASFGEYILPLDADDTISPVYLEQAVRQLQTRPACKIVYGQCWLTGDRNEPFPLPPFSIETLLRDNCIFNSSVYRREDFEAVGGYNPNMKEGYEDWNLWLSLLEGGGEVCQLPEVVYYYRIQPKSRSTRADSQEMQLRLQLLENHRELYLRHYLCLYDRQALLSPAQWWFRLSSRLRRINPFAKKKN